MVKLKHQTPISMRLFLIVSLVFSSLSFPLTAGCLTMQSSNYKIMTDVISVGGETSTSTNYQVFNTVGEFGVTDTRSTSTGYILDAGFQPSSTATNLSSTLSTNSINLGTLSPSTVSSGSQTLTVSTDSATGYTVTIQDDGDLRSGANSISDIISGGTVTAGTPGYGISTEGVAGQMNSITTSMPLTTSPQILAATSTPAANEQTIITYKAAIGSGTAYGTYSHTVTFTTVVNY
ncbi:MAG: hypothetical protein NTU97_02330 [Candidatus Magasanikbacteria bacterium]|nr:hypothetical protein [Candidatus Magasanikbacteria bacterium]